MSEEAKRSTNKLYQKIFESLKFELRKKMEHVITFSLGIAKKMVLLDKFKPRNQSESISTTE